MLSRQVIVQMELRRELTERAKAEKELRASEARKAAIFESALDCIITMDTTGRVVEWNPAAEWTFGYLADEAIGSGNRRTDRTAVLTGRASAGHGPVSDHRRRPVLGKRIEIPAMRADGSEFPVEMAITPVPLENQTLFTAYLRDITERKQAEEALRQAREELEAHVQTRTAELSQANQALQNEIGERRRAEENYRSLFENAVEGIFQSTPQGGYLSANPALARLYGYDSPAEMLRGLADIEKQLYVQPERRAEFARLMQENDTLANFEAEVFRRDGTTIWISEAARAIRDADGNLVRYEGTVEDISARKQAEDALRESEARYQRIAANVPGMVFQCAIHPDGTMDFPFVSEGCREIYGLEPWEIRETPSRIVDIIYPEDMAAFAESITRTVTDLLPWKWEGRILTRAGITKWVQGVSRPERQPNGDILCEGLLRDVSERRTAQDAQQESEERYRSLVEHSPEGIVVYSEDRIVYANPAAAALFAASDPGELMGRLIFDFVHPDYHRMTRERAQRSQVDGRPSALQQQKYVRLDGQVIDVEAVSTPILFQGKRAGQVLIRDITERKQAEEQISALNLELTQAYDATIEGWSRALDLRDHETEGHCRRVTELTLRLAAEMGMTSEELVHVRRGALLHDIGKMGVPDRVLLKPGPSMTANGC